MDVIPIAKPHFCTCSTFINICKDGHVLTCKPDAMFLFYFFVATNSTYVSVSVRVYIFFHLCRMKTTNTAKKKNRSTETNLIRIYHVRNTCGNNLLFFLLYPHGEGGKGDSLVKVEGGSFVKVEGGSLVKVERGSFVKVEGGSLVR